MVTISVIIPCFNIVQEYIRQSVNSVLSQDFQDYEIILVDDGSSPPYKKILQEIEQLDTRIHLISQLNKGVSAARNTGISYAKGEYITFVDADDKVVPHFLSSAYQIAKNYQADFVVGGVCFTSNMTLSIKKTTSPHIKEFEGASIQDCRPYFIGNTLVIGKANEYIGRGSVARLIHHSLIKQVHFDEELSIGEDIVWNLKILTHCKKVCITYEIWYLYYHNPQSAIHKYNEKIIDAVKVQFDYIEKYINRNNNREYTALCNHLLEELRRIYDCYLGRSECPISGYAKKQIIRSLYLDRPWIYIGSKRYFRLAEKKEKIKSLLYRYRLLFLFWKSKKQLLRISALKRRLSK